VLYNLHRYTRGYAGLRARVQLFHTHEKKPVGLRIKPVPVPTGTNSHPNPHPIGFLPAGTRVKYARCHPYATWLWIRFPVVVGEVDRPPFSWTQSRMNAENAGDLATTHVHAFGHLVRCDTFKYFIVHNFYCNMSMFLLHLVHNFYCTMPMFLIFLLTLIS
jgi:hypothetical protein